MLDMNNFDVVFSGLKTGYHTFEYDVDCAIFEHFGYSDLNGASLRAKLILEKQLTIINFLFHVEGVINLSCDVSNAPFDMPIDSKWKLIVKFGEVYNDDDELLVLPYGAHKVNITRYFYEIVVLSIPMKRVHPNLYDEGFLPKEIFDRSNLVTEKKKDSRWDKLKELLDTK